MSSSEPFNFGRKIKELKRIHKKGYADLTAGLKISRERLIQLEENEREPNEVERRRFAAYYGLPVEEFGIFEGGTPPPPAPPARPGPGYGNYTPNAGRPGYDNPPSYGGERQGGYPQERPAYQGGFQDRQGGDRPGYQDRGNYQDRQGGDRPGYQDRGGFQDRGGYQDRQGGDRPGYQDRQGGNFGGGRPNYGGGGRPQGPGGGGRPGFGGPGGGRPQGPGGGGRPAQSGGERPAPRPKPADSGEPKEPKSGENKPVMKYTAEQLGDIESAYLRKQRDLKVPLTFTFLNGKEYTGVVTDFTPFTIHIMDVETGQEVILRKLAMAYYRKADALAEASRNGVNGDKPDAGRS